MNSIVQDYINRFTPNGFAKPEWSTFFTQFDITDYHQKLPYIFGIELFNFRLLKAFILQEKICIYSDYDTDAVTATATMFHGLLELGFLHENISFYAPDRFTEGYGMNSTAIEELAKNYDLIISVDCGINSREEAEVVNNLRQHSENKIADLIITDHHQLIGTIPNALAVVNPRLSILYAGNPELNLILKENIQKSKQSLFEWMDEVDDNKVTIDSVLLKSQKLKDKIGNWVEKVEHNTKTFDVKSSNYLTSSATGVGVAWFCLVWLAYFMEEIGV